MDKRDEALEYIDKALKLVPNYESAIEAKSKLSVDDLTISNHIKTAT